MGIERHCALLGFGYPESPFKLFSQKQVGKGGLAGMRVAHYLKQQLGQKIIFWPYEVETKETRLIVTEIYPRLFWRMSGFGNKKVIDLESLNKGLLHYGSLPIKAGTQVNNHDTDALISAAGMRSLSGGGLYIPKILGNAIFMLLLFPPTRFLKIRHSADYDSFLKTAWTKKSNCLKPSISKYFGYIPNDIIVPPCMNKVKARREGWIFGVKN